MVYKNNCKKTIEQKEDVSLGRIVAECCSLQEILFKCISCREQEDKNLSRFDDQKVAKMNNTIALNIEEPFKSILILSLCLLSVSVVAINGVSLIIIKESLKMSTAPSMYFIINLLIVDIVQGIFVIPIYAIKKLNNQNRFWDGIICNSFRFLYMTTYYLSIFSVLFIAVDRYIASTYIFKYKTLIKVEKVRFIIIASWIYVIALCTIPFYHRNSSKVNITRNIDYCLYRQNSLWTTAMLLINCFLPYFIIMYLYKCIYKKFLSSEKESNIRTVTSVRSQQSLKQFEEQSKVNSTFNKNTKISEQTKNILKVSILISICYAICWTPSVIYYVLNKFCPEKCFTTTYINSVNQTYLEFAIKYFGFLNSLAAPMIYCFSLKRFRFQFRNLIQTYLSEKRLPSI
ncbi:beta-2 adrenergic receptor isoform X1 [Hydra vulgaris]|uniref:beta-2 adrenergic receptor isoform X1 n=1 Tax=Hydra vulgaris TaxID=6087 RepID=UPI001F5F04B8|nr:beta-2 adrenergic receptor-like [Hydra vulgaris]